MARKKINISQIGMKVAGIGAGAVAGKFVNKFIPNFNPKIRGLLKIGVGALLPSLVKNTFIGDAGSGMVAVGAAEIVEDLGVAGLGIGRYGVGNIDEYIIDEDYLHGVDDEGGVGNIEQEGGIGKTE
jgi:hypothetical protein